MKRNLEVIKLSDVILAKKLGDGNFGVVNEVVYHGQKMAAKSLKLPANVGSASDVEKTRMRKQLAGELHMMWEEAATLKDVDNHPGVVLMYGSIFDDNIEGNCISGNVGRKFIAIHQRFLF